MDIDRFNWGLRNEAIQNARGWMKSSHYLREKFIMAARWVNYAIYETEKIGGDPRIRDLLYSKFSNENDETGLLAISEYNLAKLADYAKRCAMKGGEEGDRLFIAFMSRIYLKMGNQAVDFMELIDLAAKVKDDLGQVLFIFEFQTPESMDWYTRARECDVLVQAASEIETYMRTWVAGLTGRTDLGLKIDGDTFCTDNESITVPSLVKKWPTKEENAEDYKLTIIHECGHVARKSFEISVFEAELHKLGYRIRNPHLLNEKSEYVEVETLDGKPVLDTGGEERRLKLVKGGKDVPRKFKTAKDLWELFKEPELAFKINNMIDDRRIDDLQKAEYVGFKEKYTTNNQRHLITRPVPTDDNNPSHVLEAFLQLVIVPIDLGEVDGRRENARAELKRLIPERDGLLAPLKPIDEEIKKANSERDIGRARELTKRRNELYKRRPLKERTAFSNANARIAGLEREILEMGKLIERQIAVRKMHKALELAELAKRGMVGGDGTNSFNATVDVALRFKEMFKDQDYSKDVQQFDNHLFKENLDGLGNSKLKVRPKKKEKEGGDGGGNGGKKSSKGGQGGGGSGAQPKDDADETGGHLSGGSKMQHKYREWDQNADGGKGTYRKDWATVMEVEAEEGEILPPHPVTSQVVEIFRRLVPKKRRKKRGLEDGRDVDPMLYVDYLVKRRAGLNPQPKFWSENLRIKRSVAALMLVDASGSTICTKPADLSVFEIELQAMHTLGAALGEIGDIFAVWAFDSIGKDMVNMYKIKGWNEQIGNKTKCGGNCTRMGTAIRHATELLLKREERTKLLFVLSDGFPDDGDNYQGKYAMEDTRKAVDEAVARGVVAFCIAVRMEPNEIYLLGKVFGEGRVLLISDVGQLPLMFPLFYKQVTRLGV